MRVVKFIGFVLVFSCVLQLSAQTPSGHRWPNLAVSAVDANVLNLPGTPESMSFFDGRLHIMSDGMLFVCDIDPSDGRILPPEIDRQLLAIHPQATYAVRRPGQDSAHLFVTVLDSKGHDMLYEAYEKKPGKWVLNRVKPYGFSYSVEHPVFSPDGHAMIFSSDCPLGFGGRDLWYCEWNSGKWQYPQNMGHHVNSEGDEVLPALYGDFLLFSSNGRADGCGGHDLYATRLVAQKQLGDTVMMYPIGKCKVQSLEPPFCSDAHDYSIVPDANARGGWWVSRDTVGNVKFHYFSAPLRCVRVTWVVADKSGHPLANAQVTVSMGNGVEQTMPVAPDGSFCLYQQPSQPLQVRVKAPGYYPCSLMLNEDRNDEELLYNSFVHDVSLASLRMDSIYRHGDLFASSVGSELSPKGRVWMDSVACFLKENPNLKVTIVSAYNLSFDLPFCMLINQSRLRSVRDYLSNSGVMATSIQTSTSVPQGIAIPFNNTDNNESPVSKSSRTLYLIFSKK